MIRVSNALGQLGKPPYISFLVAHGQCLFLALLDNIIGIEHMFLLCYNRTKEVRVYYAIFIND